MLCYPDGRLKVVKASQAQDGASLNGVMLVSHFPLNQLVLNSSVFSKIQRLKVLLDVKVMGPAQICAWARPIWARPMGPAHGPGPLAQPMWDCPHVPGLHGPGPFEPGPH